MAKLLSLVGRAWSFALRHLKGEHFIQHDCQSVPRMLKEAAEALRGKGELSYENSRVPYFRAVVRGANLNDRPEAF